MRLYPRQQVEESLITHYKVGKSLPARSLQREVFAGVPGVYIGVEQIGVSSDAILLLGIVFFAEASHPDEPIPHFRNLNELQSKTLGDNLHFLPHRIIHPIAEHRLLHILRELGYKEVFATWPYNTTHGYAVPTAGLVLVGPDVIRGTLGNPKMGREVYNKWESER